MIRIWLIIASAFLLSACQSTPHNEIGAFAQATQEITLQVDEVIVEINQSHINKQLMDIATQHGSGREPLTRETLQSVTPLFDQSAQKQMAIYRANHALNRYAKGLQALSGAVNQADIDIAAAELASAMNGMNTSYTLLTNNDDLFQPKDMSIVASAVAALGTSIVEKQRQESLKSVITQADEKVNLITDELVTQLADSGMEELLVSSRSTHLKHALRDYSKRSSKQPMTFEQSYNETQALYELYTIMSQTKLSLHQTRQAIKAVKKAHNGITQEVQADRFNSKGIIAIVGELKNQWERYDDFRDVVTSCEKGYELTGDDPRSQVVACKP